MFRTLIRAAIPLALAAALAGCKTNDPGKLDFAVNLPKPPAHYLACFNKLTDIPVESLTREKVVRLVAELRQSELRLSRCGKDLLDWYEVVREGFGKRA